MNQGSNFLGSTFSNGDNVRTKSNLEEKVNPSILKDYFSSKTDPPVFTSIAPVLLDQSNEISYFFPALKSTSYFLSQFTVSCRLDLSSEANSVSDTRQFLEISYLLQLVIEFSIYLALEGNKEGDRISLRFFHSIRLKYFLHPLISVENREIISYYFIDVR